MENVATILILVTAAAHVAFMVIEMLPWKRPLVFDMVRLGFDPGLKNEMAAASIVHNAGLYNGFIAAGLAWSSLPGPDAFHLRLFFLSCAILAGIFGAFTLTYKTLVLQTLPALAALVVIHLR